MLVHFPSDWHSHQQWGLAVFELMGGLGGFNPPSSSDPTIVTPPTSQVLGLLAVLLTPPSSFFTIRTLGSGLEKSEDDRMLWLVKASCVKDSSGNIIVEEDLSLESTSMGYQVSLIQRCLSTHLNEIEC